MDRRIYACDDTQKSFYYWQLYTEQFKQGPDPAFDEKGTMNNTVYKTFKLHSDHCASKREATYWDQA